MTVNYADLIHEAFVAPLRSATIIDDEYPTWEDWLGGHAAHGTNGKITDPKGKRRWESSEKIVKRIEQLRERSLIVDIHDGGSESGRIQNYHHSDLVILDYQLDGQNGDGSRSMEIARRLLTENDHFNLIVLHTQQDDDRLITPFVDLLTRLMRHPDAINQKLIDQGEDLIAELELSERLQSAFGPQHYATISAYGWAHFRTGLADGNLAENHPIFAELTEIAAEQELTKQQIAQLTAALCHKLNQKYRDHFAGNSAPGLTWSKGDNLWIKTNRGFIAFTSKKSKTNLIEVLLGALSNWQPTPSRLISGKIRNLLHAQGSQLEDHFLQRDHVGWLFYRSLVEEGKQSTSPAVNSELSRQVERYTDLIRDGITEFGAKILESDAPADGGCDTRNGGMYSFSEAENDDAHDHYNCFVSCKPHTGLHLAPGKILVDGEDYWVVVSPSCDLVPGQKNSGGKTASYMKFTAARLHPKKNIVDVRSSAETGNFIFLKMQDEKVKAFSIYGAAEGSTGERYLTQRAFLADNEGRFHDSDGNLELIARFEVEHSVSKILNFQRVDFVVHDQQLRYEYALNLLSKVGAHASRVGLDYRCPQKPPQE
ncbi:response regulator receiver domain [Aliiroseovarius subalbicans]|uniref:response regulator receiver domain n=1 Tax=Aliiroseovarius subalbicans TaxID=2925840 RepID=UPI001F5A2016|nr:response regulator receiver domain [Aliiroseovarius subalbicans]MCI2400814.1 response regulator receiver domain [Aliiroseovarius subalbicans]